MHGHACTHTARSEAEALKMKCEAGAVRKHKRTSSNNLERKKIVKDKKGDGRYSMHEASTCICDKYACMEEGQHAMGSMYGRKWEWMYIVQHA